MENAQHTSFLSKARAFACKTAVIAIAPLALVQVAHAAPLTTFGNPTSGPLYNFSMNVFSGGGSFNETSYSSSQLAPFNSITGATMQRSGTFDLGAGGGGFVDIYFGQGGITGTALSPGVSIPTTYGFTLSSSGSLTVSSWKLEFGFTDPATPNFVVGSGLGSFSGNLNLITGATTTNYLTYLTIDMTGASLGEVITIDMTGIGQGVAYNVAPIPEPSTYALFFGIGALGFVAVRRRLRSAA